MAKTDKADKKVKKADKKTGKKCGALLAFLALAATLCGCLHPEGQPSRSQTQNNDFSHCVVVIASKATVSNDCVIAEGDGIQPNEIFTQTMKNEGSESNSPTMTPTQTTDVSPKTDVNTTGGRSAGVLESIVGAFGTWLATPSGKEATATAAAASAACPNGNCSPNGTCTDGSCSTGACTDGSCTVK